MPSDLDSPNADSLVRGIGQRIRGLRARRGMTRRDLSAHSNVSERYLADAESGRANISIGILLRIGEALQVDLADLLPHRQAPRIEPALLALLSRLSDEQQKAAFELLKTRFADAPTQSNGVALIGQRSRGN